MFEVIFSGCPHVLRNLIVFWPGIGCKTFLGGISNFFLTLTSPKAL